MHEAGSERRGPGRPREIVRREPGTGAPLGTTLGDYQPTTRAILRAARTLVLARGARALTLGAVADEAHVDVTTVTYHFGTRGGLLEALVASLYDEPVAAFVSEAQACSSPAERAQALFRALRQEVADEEGARVYVAVVSEGLRDERVRRRLAGLNGWTVRAFAEAVYGDAAEEMLRDEQTLAAMQLTAAAVDGIELHHMLDPDGFKLDAVFELLERLTTAPPLTPPPSEDHGAD
jgi:AcrR family transcriptional regulator